MIDKELISFIKKNLTVANSLDNNLKTRRNLQHFLMIKPPTRSQADQYQLVLSHAITAEKMCPGAGVIFLKLVCGHVVEPTVPPKNKTEFFKLLYDLNLRDELVSIIRSSVEVADVNSSFVIKKSQKQSYIEIVEGHQFDLKNLITSNGDFYSTCKVACIDGYVESVSELHHLFTKLSESGLPCMLFLRGMSDDVLHTIKVNNDRKTMTVIPFIVPFDVDNVNVIVDIAVTSGTDVVASTKGQLINSVSIENLGTVKNCYIFGGRIKYSSDDQSVKKRVKEHTDFLKKMILERPDTADLLSQRIKSLSSRRIEIGIPDDINFYSNQQQLDECIRIISAILGRVYHPYECAKKYFESYASLSSKDSLYLLCDNEI